MGRDHRARTAVLAASLTLTLVAAACGSDGGGDGASPADDAATTTVAAGSEGEGVEGAGGCPGATALEVVNGGSASGTTGDAVELADGPVDVVTSFADGEGGNATFVFADYEVEADPQFGLSAPVGDPEVPDGGLIMVISITTGGEGDLVPGQYGDLAPGEGAVESPGDLTDPDATIPDVPASVNFEALYLGADRILPIGEHSVTLTEVTDTTLCGELTGDTGETQFQSDGFPVLTGTFVAERV